jgi:serine protease AprX
MDRKSQKAAKKPAKKAAAKKGVLRKAATKKAATNGSKLTPPAAAESTPIQREDLESIIYRDAGLRRYTQDSPVLPDVWFKFGQEPRKRVDLLLTPHRDSTPGEIANELLERLRSDGAWQDVPAFECDESCGNDVAFNQSTVVARLCFSELVRIILPMTDWWRDHVWAGDGQTLKKFLTNKQFQASVAEALKTGRYDKFEPRVPEQLLWMVKIVGIIALASLGSYEPAAATNPKLFIDACVKLLKGFAQRDEGRRLGGSVIWSVSLNRKASFAILRSTVAIKADAARRLFEISCKGLSWAVIDSGVDARHPAFRDRQADGTAYGTPFDKVSNGPAVNRTRVKATYDFTILRYLLSENESLPETLTPLQQKRLDKAYRKLGRDSEGWKQFKLSLFSGRYINWDSLLPLLEVRHAEGAYEPPPHPHGTHVAGVLAADWRQADKEKAPGNDLQGVCPDVRLYDLRVLDENGEGDEFAIIAALQFVRHLNAHRDHMTVHGVNLSFSLLHDVANYACGSTPICEECTRLTGSGIVVVAAAGNEGYMHYLMTGGKSYEGYRSISITDPGNTEDIITVGATHRERPHTYGVSYFSSRGPTGDGRNKPDLVAPGEKIISTVPGPDLKRMDGTSMASPHVSGAAVLLMARYKELIGRPKMIKEILCRTATDLGRERYFQGAGMLDVLRAIQSV